MATVLLVEDEPILARNVCESLSLAGHDVVSVTTGEEAADAAVAARPDVIVLDYRLPGIDGLVVLERLRQGGSTSAVIMMTAHGNVDTAVAAMKAGADDFLTKPVDLAELNLVIERTLKRRNLTDEVNYFRNRERADSALDSIIGVSAAIQAVKAFIARVTSTSALGSPTPPSVLITGETGVGKDLTARAIHYAGPRHKEQFVHVNCTAIPDQLAESELFGHVKGAFTDARRERRGLFEVADGGTLFLNEIGHMSLALQGKLLGVLERRVIRPVGATRERTIDVHVIAATNRDLSHAIEVGEFRQDLFHRLRVLAINLPPLRDREDDVATLAEHFLHVAASRYSLGVNQLSASALEAIRVYDWPGNVRELMHAIESAVLMADSSCLDAIHLNITPVAAQGAIAVDLPTSQQTIAIDFARDCPKLDEVEHQIIQAALTFSQHNLSRAARLLGISRDAIRYRLERFSQRGDSDPVEP